MTDLAKLLEPLGSDSPTGADLRYVDGDLTLQKIRQGRAEDDPALAVGGDVKPPNWRQVISDCEQALTTRTKDLEIAGWLTEALTRLQGFEGTRDGLRLCKELVATYWERLHPGLDGGEIVLPVRAKPLNWLGVPNGLVRAVKLVPLLPRAGAAPLCWSDFEQSERVDAARLLTDQSQFKELTAAGRVSGEVWQQALAATPAAEREGVASFLRECEAELGELNELCQQRFGEAEAPSFIRLREAISVIREGIEPKAPEQEAAEGEAAPISGGDARVPTGPIGSRADALRTLGLVADFFRRTEPHSPISYLVQRAVRWGSMPLEELLKEVVKSDDALAHIWETLGIRVEKSS
jgi:type VI secretion system protein ImpA